MSSSLLSIVIVAQRAKNCEAPSAQLPAIHPINDTWPSPESKLSSFRGI